MSEYMIDGVLLTNIADAVRAVDGSSSALTPAQMQARLTAVKSSIDAALSALTAKEVTVPSGSNVHKLAELIASIEAGGGASGFAKVTKGSVTITSIISSSTLTIEHGLGQKPDIAILYSPFEFTKDGITACIMLYNGAFVNAGYNSRNNSSSRQGVYFGTDASMDETSFTVQGKLHYGSNPSVSPVSFVYRDSYEWIAGVFA